MRTWSEYEAVLKLLRQLSDATVETLIQSGEEFKADELRAATWAVEQMLINAQVGAPSS